MANFEVDPRITADCHCLGKWGGCWVMLNRDASVRWFIIVPETGVNEWHELPAPIQDELARMASSLGGSLKEQLSCDKVNIAAIGNVVPQFHFHVIGRWRSDPYWPGVVWGRSTVAREYSEREIADIRQMCFDALKGEDSRALAQRHGVRGPF